MDSGNNNSNNRSPKRNKKHRKAKKSYSWKILNELESTTSDQDSDGTTGSVGINGRQRRDSSDECSSSFISDEKSKKLNKEQLSTTPISEQNQFEVVKEVDDEIDKNAENVPIGTESTETANNSNRSRNKKNRHRHKIKLNYVHNKNEKINSILNALLVAALLIVSGLASGHYLASHSRSMFLSNRLPTSILNRYINRTIEMYERLIDENDELRDRIQKLEYSMGMHLSDRPNGGPTVQEIEQFEKDILQSLIKLFDKEITSVLSVLSSTNPNDVLTKSEPTVYEKDSELTKSSTFSTDFQKDECDFERMIEQGKALQRRLKMKKTLQKDNENIEKFNKEKEKNNQVDATNKGETFLFDKERVIETLSDADYVIAACDSNNSQESEQSPISVSNAEKYNIKNGYVCNIRKLFEPNLDENDVCSIEDGISAKSFYNSTQSTKDNKNEIKSETSIKNEVLFGPLTEADSEPIYGESFNMSTLIGDRKDEIRESKRKSKQRSNEHSKNGRTKRKSKYNYDKNSVAETIAIE